jgi:hypothetical protein
MRDGLERRLQERDAIVRHRVEQLMGEDPTGW